MKVQYTIEFDVSKEALAKEAIRFLKGLKAEVKERTPKGWEINYIKFQAEDLDGG
jgi:hypothetical protein